MSRTGTWQSSRSSLRAEHPEDLLAVVSVDHERPGIGRRRRRGRHLSLEDVLGNIALAEVDIPIGVADTFVPAHRVRHVIAGRHRRVPRTPMAWPLRVVVR